MRTRIIPEGASLLQRHPAIRSLYEVRSIKRIGNLNKQLKETVSTLRGRIETKEAQRIEELQVAAKIKRDEHSQLEAIINTLREKLEVKDEDKN